MKVWVKKLLSKFIENKNDFATAITLTNSVNITITRNLGIEGTYFFNLDNIDRTDLYIHEDFGIGCKYKSAEGLELLYRLLRKQHKGIYNPGIKIYHRNMLGPTDFASSIKRIEADSFGEGAFLRRFFNKGDLVILQLMLRKMFLVPLYRIVMSVKTLDKNLMLLTISRVKGLWKGFLAYTN